MRRSLLLALLFAATTAFAQNQLAASSTDANGLPTLEHFDVKMVDASANPCSDFYKYACGKWMAAHPIPADQAAWSTASGLQIWNETVLRQTLEQAANAAAQRSPNEQKIGDYWYSCMDTTATNANTASDLKPELARIAAIKNKRDLAVEVAHLSQTIPDSFEEDDNQTDAPMVGFTAQPDYHNVKMDVAFMDQAGMGLPGRDYYLKTDADTVKLRQQYVDHIAKMFVLAGVDQKQAAADSQAVLAMETEMAKAMMDPVTRRDPKNVDNPMTLAQAEALTPSFDWPTYLKLVNAPTSPKYVVTAPNYFRALEKMIQEHPLDHWKAYLRWHMLNGYATALGDDFVNENFNFVRAITGSQKLQPRWRRCVRSTDVALGEALGQAYVAKAFPASSKQDVLQIVQNIEAEMAKDIQAQTWMAPQTKQQAEEKLHAVLNKIGYPNHWRDYSSVRIGRNDYLANVKATSNFEFERWVKKIGQPLDRTEWGMTPPTINAYEDPQTNTINFPAGILQPPFFDPSQDLAANYGSEGSVIGHELIHGFDDEGRKFDTEGNLRDWWTPQDTAEYTKRGACIANQYSQDQPLPGIKQNGLLTQGEDTADNGGIHLSWLAFNDALKKEGKNAEDKDSAGVPLAQEFFVAYADSWCTNVRPQIMRLLIFANPHSIPVYRVNNVVSNSPEFQQAFSCRPGDAMVRGANACRIW